MTEYKPGDRVRVVYGHGWDGVGVVQKTYAGCRDVLVKLDDGREGAFSECEVKPAILTVEAGKFYRTRDGRKVGPMEEHGVKERVDGALPNGEHAVWNRADGTHWSFYSDPSPDLDLIAEWVDEPAVKAEPAREFRVGDRVRVVANNGVRVSYVGKEGRVENTGSSGLTVLIDGEKYGLYFEASELLPATPTTPKVGDWVKDTDGDIGIVFHDDGDTWNNLHVGYVEGGGREYRSPSELTVVPPGTKKAPEPEAVPANDNYEVNDLVEVMKNDGFFSPHVKAGDYAVVSVKRDSGELTLNVHTAYGKEIQWITPSRRPGYIRPYKKAA